MTTAELPVITVGGAAHERGLQYGRQAADRVQRTRSAYAEVYAHFATWEWDRVREEAQAFIDPIRAFHPDSLDEMAGIAEGAGLEFVDVLAMNLRTEILFAAKVRASGAELPPMLECTSFAARNSEGAQLIGQTWDWLTFSADTVVLVESTPENGPAFMTVVEAGLLAKLGMNSAGLALATNALVTAADTGRPGIPYHVMLRALLDCRTPTEAATLLQSAHRSSSANYLFGTGEGLVVDAETRPGSYADISWGVPDDDGLLLHANHFTVAPAGTVNDVGAMLMADSLFRLQRVRRLARESPQCGVEQWKNILSDHAGSPAGICCHPDPGTHSMDQWTTATGAIFEPADRRAHISVGNPCRGEWLTREYAQVWA
ncbi:C45 family autoproteolytic acyltransferase/hydolase [Mycolicibacterium tokaiense]|uniref:Peptidase C45 acyl-coenzyme A:6-aminopenicillanic acid acyl-transferase n=1 Tax=Mycolicibacterium tokaiense TaxID=39695 RepID=A0A378TG58_9MYCO|nr:C45 family peptidase [Mycolicibacterium tokaiense]BBY85706.1 acyl-CoA--6-aminopenicillanic acid acyl-transferase [Mycolicibacterium tokaiense]STZ59781.1 peptidase C45 acyl-coenzyme A:6-aminopenicillanic acid acyl-transferase [Mycolicibacterium tokaiense]